MAADLAGARARMVQDQLVDRGITDRRVLGAMAAVPRERFVGADLRDLAYLDGPLPIGASQTISQSYVVALMLELAAIGARDRVLEVGAGSGYVAALLGHLSSHVFALERHEALAREAAARIAALGLEHVDIRTADGSRGLPDEAPFDVILVSAAPPALPEALREQLAPGGRLVIPVGTLGRQALERHVRGADGGFDVSRHGGVAFVPLVSGAE